MRGVRSPGRERLGSATSSISWCLPARPTCFRRICVFSARKQLAIHTKTSQLHGFVVIRSLMHLSCLFHSHAGRIFICELMVPRMQHEFNQRSDAPYGPPPRQNTSGIDKMLLLLLHFRICYLKLREPTFSAQEGPLLREDKAGPVLVALSKVTGRSPAPWSCQPPRLLL